MSLHSEMLMTSLSHLHVPTQSLLALCMRLNFLLFSTAFQDSHLGLIGVAAFVGLRCSHEQATRVWNSHTISSSHGDYTSSGLTEEVIEWMTALMAKLLPPPLALRWGVIPIDPPFE